MPKLSVWFVRASLLHMGIGILLGALILHHKGVPIYTWTWKLLNPHIELMVFGWTMQFVMGMAYWILPRLGGEHRYGRTSLGWWAFALLNLGIGLTALGGWSGHAPLALGGRLFAFLAVAAFAVLIWPRVKPLGEVALSTIVKS